MQIIIKTWDKDIYILDGYKSAEEAEKKLAQSDQVEMPTGTILKTSAIQMIMPYEDYVWQQKQKQNHKRGEYLKNGSWYNENGEARKADVKLISGELNNRLKGVDNPRIESEE